MPAFALTALKHWKLIGLGLLLMAFAVQQVRVSNRDNKIAALRIDLNEVRSERDSLIAAAKEAERLNKEQVKRIVTEQDRISKDVEADLTARLERLRGELRAKANNGNSQGPGTGSDGNAAPATPGEAGLCLTPEELLRAAENEERHDQLITWIEEQLKVRR